MTVDELITAILTAYPGANPDAMATFSPVYRARFGKREGPHLRAAFETTLAEFKPKYGQPFPVPADFERHMPSLKREADNGKDGGPPIDLPGRKRRADSLYASWQAGQCRRADKGNPLLRKALENIARQVADVMGWDENPPPLVLSHAQLKTACQSAISLERRHRYGHQLPKDKHVWWQQIASIATEWNIQNVTPEWWDKTTGDAFKEGFEPRVVQVYKAPTTTREGPPIRKDPEAHISLLKDNIRFLRDMGIIDAIPPKERELAQALAEHESAKARGEAS